MGLLIMTNHIAIQKYIWMLVLLAWGVHMAIWCMLYPSPKANLNYNIAHLEILNIIVALKVWATHWANRRIRIHCDNMAVVEVLNSGRAYFGLDG